MAMRNQIVTLGPAWARRIVAAVAFIGLLSMVGAVVPNGTSATPLTDGNPDLPRRCGLDMTLIIDRSGSIQEQSATVAAASNALVQGLAGTGSRVQVISFATRATAFDDANGDGDNEDLEDLRFMPADELVVPEFPSQGYTNWDDALEMARRSPAGVAPLTVILTDGNPTALNFDSPNGHGGPVGANADPITQNLANAAAVVEATQLKLQGTHMLAVGVGNSVNGTRLRGISGNEQINSGGAVTFAEGDWTLVDFGELKTLLEDFTRELCASSLNITKTEITAEGEPRPGNGWRMNLELDAQPATWTSPAQPSGNLSASLETVDGKANFKWSNADVASRPSATVAEEALPGWTFESVSCTRRDLGTNETTPLEVQAEILADGSARWSIPDGISGTDSVNCSVVNRLTDPGATTTTTVPTTTVPTTTTTTVPTTTTTTSTSTTTTQPTTTTTTVPTTTVPTTTTTRPATTTTQPTTTTTTTTSTTTAPTTTTSVPPTTEATTTTSLPDGTDPEGGDQTSTTSTTSSTSSTSTSTPSTSTSTTSTSVPPADVAGETTSSIAASGQSSSGGPSSSPGQSLAVTGVSAAAGATVGAVVLMLGLGLLGASRRRRTSY
jgi:hypothetical protein